MGLYLGLDTSNYTTSAAVYDSDSGHMKMAKKLLPVKGNACGLRQSDAVFLHVKQLGALVRELFEGETPALAGIGVSGFPRRAEGSYMPCFLVGEMASDILSGVYKIPRYIVSHQEGHIAAALFSCGRMDLLEQEFYAFHVSGGTTEAMLVRPENGLFSVELIAKTRDLNAGQIIDRVGVMMGLHFPCGRELEQLALGCPERKGSRPVLKGLDCCLSGLENQCEKVYKQSGSKEQTARYCLESLMQVFLRMTDGILEQYGTRPLIYAGGVMSNSLIRETFTARYGAGFAASEYSCDNSAGVALLASIAAQK